MGFLDSALKSLLLSGRMPYLRAAVEFPSIGLRLVNWPDDVTIAGKTFLGFAGLHKFTLKIEGLGQTIRWEVPAATVTMVNQDNFIGPFFDADSFRGQPCSTYQLYSSAGVLFDLGLRIDFTADVDKHDPNSGETVVRLSAADAVHGAGAPRRTTSEFGCPADFMGDGCGFRWNSGVHQQSLQTCDKGVSTVNGCFQHFRPVRDPVTQTLVAQPIPFNGFPGDVDPAFVRAPAGE